MKRSEKDRLLREILADEALEQMRQATLAAGVGALRRRRRVHALMGGATASLVLLLACAALVYRRAHPVHAPLSPTVPVAENRAAVKWIDDEQLLARFSDRGAALVGPPGRQKLIFFDTPTASSAAVR
jgi:hypothetical protein